MTAITAAVSFGAQENKVCLFPLFLHLFALSDGNGCHGLIFLNAELHEALEMMSNDQSHR